MKSLLLVLPRSERGYWGKVHHGKAGFVRLSLPTVAALTPADWNVRILDARVEPVPYDQPVDLVGLTAFTAEAPSAYGIADEFRRRGVPVVMGGIHASARPDEALGHVDAVVLGEAEDVWETVLADAVAGRLKPTYRAGALCVMRAMKTPRLDLVKREMYTSFNTLQATRGCPFDCDYCAVTGVFGRKFRTRPVAEVIEVIRAFDTRQFYFVDDNICGHPGYAKELFRALIPLKKTWGGQSSITFARDPDLLRLYAQSGGSYAFIGFESINEEALKRVNKGWNKADDYGEAIRKIHGAGIDIVASFIVGLDGDGPDVFERLFEFIMKHRISAAQFHILAPFPGTRLYDRMAAEGRITDHDWAKYHTSEVVYEPKGMTAEQLQRGYYEIYHQTYTVKNMLKRVFRSWRGIPERLAVNIAYRNKARRMPGGGEPGGWDAIRDGGSLAPTAGAASEGKPSHSG